MRAKTTLIIVCDPYTHLAVKSPDREQKITRNGLWKAVRSGQYRRSPRHVSLKKA